MSFKGLKAIIRFTDIEEIDKFRELLPENIKEDFIGVLYYDEKTFGNKMQNLTLNKYSDPILEKDLFWSFDESISIEDEKILERYEKDPCLLYTIYKDTRINEECSIIYKNDMFKGKILEIGPSTDNGRINAGKY